MTAVAVIGAGAVGLTLAGRLAQHGVRVEVFEAEPEPQRIGSKAICMQRETLEIWARLGIGEQVAERGIQWRTGRTYYRGRQLFEVQLPVSDEHFPPFVNISQSEVEGLLEARLNGLGVPVHRGHRLVGLAQDPHGVTATFENGSETFDYLVGTDGAHSTVAMPSASPSTATPSTTASSSPMSAPGCPSRTSGIFTSIRRGIPAGRCSSTRSPMASGASTGRCHRRPMWTPSARPVAWSVASGR